VGSVIWTVPVELAADAKAAAVSLPYKIEEAKSADKPAAGSADLGNSGS
jgi:hypothetical protein